MDTTLLLAAACAALLLAVLVLAWLHFKPQISVALAPQAPIEPPKPTRIKCNARRFTFARWDEEEGATITGDLVMHPVCNHTPLEQLTEDWARAKWPRRFPWMPDLELVGVSDHVHFIEP